MSALISISCAGCGASMQAYPAHLKRGRGRFCSRECRRRASLVQVACAWCSASLERYAHHAGNYKHQFCDNQCRGKWQTAERAGMNSPHCHRVVVMCAHCGKALERGRAHVAAYSHQFCDNACQWAWRRATGAMHGNQHPLYKGGYQGYYGPNWAIQRRVARKRDGYRCCACGVSTKQNGRALDVHHVRPFASFGYAPGENTAYLEANDLQNLVSLCRKCHKRVEHGRLGFQLSLSVHLE